MPPFYGWRARNGSRSQHAEQMADSGAKLLHLCKQACHQKCLGRKVIEEARLHQDSMTAEQLQHPIFFTTNARHLQYGVPSAFDGQHTGGRACQPKAKPLEIRSRSLANLPP